MYKLFSYLYRLLLIRPLRVSASVKASITSKGVRNVSFCGKNVVPEYCNFSGNIVVDARTTLGIHNFFHGNITFGKYCQVGAYVAIHTTNHPIHYLSTYINRNLFNGELKALIKSGRIEIGHDVWIGHNAILVGNFRVGNGAIIAAGAVVTTDVPPYSIVAGIPARVIKYRFSEERIAEAEALEWWNKDEAELIKIKPLFFKDLTQEGSLHS